MNIQPLIIYNHEHRPVMFIRGNIARKETITKYMLESPPSWGFEAQLFDQHGALPADTLVMLKRWGVQTIQVYDKTAKKLYAVSRQIFENNCVPADRGNGLNHALALEFWRVFKE